MKNDYSLTVATVSANEIELKLNLKNENFLKHIQRVFNEITELIIYYKKSKPIIKSEFTKNISKFLLLLK